MDDYGRRFGELAADGSYQFSAVRQGTITGLLPVGCLVGALIAGKISDTLGRRLSISVSSFWGMLCTIIEIASHSSWIQFAMGRFVTGISIGALSVVVPMYQSESSPVIIRGILIACYQLFVTLGIWVAEMVDFGTHELSTSASWRIPEGLSFAWALFLGLGILFLPESPRFAYRKGREEEARRTIASLAGLDPSHVSVNYQINEIRVQLDQENAMGATRWHEFFTAPRMLYRTLLGMCLQVRARSVTPRYGERD